MLRRHLPDRPRVHHPPESIGQVIRRLQQHLRGKPDRLRDVRLDLSAVTPFARTVYQKLRRTEPGTTVTYAELARRGGRSDAARAVGRVMAANPVPLLVPCHRVITADGRLGGFTAQGGAKLKARILFAEGVILNPEHAAGIEALSRGDRVMKRIIQRIGPYMATSDPPADPYTSLVIAILHQQLSLQAGATIARRLRALTPGPGVPTPVEVQGLTDAQLRGVGLSRQKMGYVRDLAMHARAGTLRLGRLRHRDDEAVIETLTGIRGIGRWSAQMFLMFRLGRLDVWPVDDLGLRKAIAYAYRLDPVPTAREMEPLGDRWRPYRSMAAWYLWQYLDAGGVR